MTAEEARGEAQRAEAALTDHLAPAFAEVEAFYQDRLMATATSEPWAKDKITNMALALSVAKAVRSHIEAVVAGGRVAENHLAHMRKIEKLSPERRRILGL